MYSLYQAVKTKISNNAATFIKRWSVQYREAGQRLMALSLFMVIVAGMVIPPASAYAATQSAADKPMAQNYPGSIDIKQSKSPVAADAQHMGALGQLTGDQAAGEPIGTQQPDKQTFTPHELVDKRTATSKVWQNADGTLTATEYATPHYYKQGKDWQEIDTNLVEDKNAADSGNIFGQALGQVESALDVTQPNTFKVAANDWQARFAGSSDSAGMVRVQYNGQSVAFQPVKAAKVNPRLVTDKDGHQTVRYDNLWPGVDVVYEVRSNALKESVNLKDSSAQANYAFTVTGAGLVSDNAKPGAFKFQGALQDQFEILPLNVMVQDRGVISEPEATQSFANGTLSVEVNQAWLKSLPYTSFPVVIDPSVQQTTFGNNYNAYKSDGYSCTYTSCYPAVGSLYDTSWKSWRSTFFVNYSALQGRVLNSAVLHLAQITSLPGDYGSRQIAASKAACQGFNCIDYNSPSGIGTITTAGDIDVTNLYQNLISNNNYSSWLILSGEEGATYSNKMIDPNYSYVTFTYSIVPSAPAVISPVGGQTFVDPQVSFSWTSVPNPNSNTPMQYDVLVSSGPGGSGTVIESGLMNATQWTIPDGMLQDGSTYYVQVRSWESWAGYSPWSAATPFKIDMRTGKDKTQAYDTVGPVSVDLATGNLGTSATSHTSAALGGALGVSLTYNSPVRSRAGLVGDYWNNTTMSGSAALERVDQNINFAWDIGTPASGTVNPDNFSAKWSGFFVAPQTGDYYFGGKNDDSLTVTVNSQTAYTSSSCTTGPCYGATAVHLTVGQVVPIQVAYVEQTGTATAQLYIKGAVPEQVVPQSWLQTGLRPINQSHGLTGHYYFDDGTHNLDSTSKVMFLQRNDGLLSFNWGAGSPVSGGPTDNFMARWTGWLTVPTSGTYQFGANGDDGTRVTINGTQVESNWQDSPGGDIWGTSINLTANQAVPVTVDYYEHAGNAAFALKVQGAVPYQVVPSDWLSPKAQVLPDGWNLGIDADGNVGYDHLKAGQNSVILTDSTGDTHEYTWTGSTANGYKPPVNEDGQLTRNADGTFTFQDTDGRTYTFAADGTLIAVTSAVDDRNPAALRYTYGSTGNGPAHLTQVADGVDPTRNATVYYSGDSNCGSAPASYDANAPTGMICAVKTNDGRTTYFYYQSGQLARIARPGNELLDYQYEQLTNGSYRINGIRDSLANDAIAAGTRSNDATVLTAIAYDSLGRVSGVTLPAATVGAAQQQQTFDYGNATAAHWQSPVPLNDTATGNPVSASWNGIRQDVFARGSANDVLHKYSNDGITWSAWESLGGCIVGDPSVAATAPGVLHIFVQGCDPTGTDFYHKWFDGTWHDWEALEPAMHITSTPTVTSWGPGRLDVYARGPGGDLIHKGLDNGPWANWSSWGGCITGAPGASTWNGHLEVFAQDCIGGTNNIAHISFDNATGLSAWGTLTGHLYGAPAAASMTQGRIDLVALDQNGYVKHSTYSTGTWGAWQTLTTCATGTPGLAARSSINTYLDMFTRGCQSGGNNLYQQTYGQPFGTTTEHVVSNAEPNGFSRRVEYDRLYRTTNDIDVANLATSTQWDAIKDLQVSATDATGLMTTTLYDDEDRPVTSYGPAPTSYFGSDRKPASAYTSQVPRTDTAYGENLTGPAVAWYDYSRPTGSTQGSLSGSPKLHTTGLTPSTPGVMSGDLVNAPITTSSGMQGMGFKATGKLRVPAGTYTVTADTADGIRVWVDDQLVLDAWGDAAYRSIPYPPNFALTGTAPHRVEVDAYRRTGVTGAFNVWMQQVGGFAWTTNWGPYLSPDYSLGTSTKTYDSTIGDVTTTTNYGATPELGLAQSTTTDASGLNLTASATYEAQGASGSYLRQLSKTLPGGNAYTYQHYGGTETRSNPCVTGSPAVSQAGLPKLKTEPDPDWAGAQTPRTQEYVYDDAGRVVATRMNNDAWKCTTYDARGRATQTVVSTINGRAGRTITDNYAVGGNPLITSATDSIAGTTTTQIDLLGRSTQTTDVFGNTSTVTYDTLGRISQRVSPLGTETPTYDNLNRTTAYILNGTTYATITYDQYSRVQGVQYPQATNGTSALKLEQIKRDNLLRPNGATFRFSNNTTFDETLSRSQTGLVLSSTDNLNGTQAASTYSYDHAGRLTQAIVDNMKYQYNYGAPSGSTCNQTNANLNANKNSNRTSFTATNQTTNTVTASATYCYDQADRLISSSDVQLGTPTYDDHGNTVTLSGNGTPLTFTYNAQDQNTSIQQGTNHVDYVKDASGTILRKKEYQNNALTASYRYLAGGQVMQSCSLTDDNSCTTTDTYVNLPGGTTLTLSPTNPDTTKRIVYSLKNFHGDTVVTANSTGAPTSSVYLYEPFGQASPSQTFGTSSSPANATNQPMGWAANPMRKVEGLFTVPVIQMGARVYLPTAGRFLQVDPVEGGTANAYVYSNDPTNDQDYSGQFSFRKLLDNAKHFTISFVAHSTLEGRLYIQASSTAQMAMGVSKATAVSRAEGQAAKFTGEALGAIAAIAIFKTAALPIFSKTATTIQNVGSRSAPLLDRSEAALLNNQASIINGRLYTGHALDAMQNAGIYPSVVENTIKWGEQLQSSSSSTMRLYEAENDVTVVLNSGGNVVTTFYGR